MKAMTVLSSIAVLAAIAVVVQGQSAASPDETTTDQEERIQSLLVERRDTLREVVEILRQHRARGSASIASVIKAENRLLDAELELAEAHQERVRLYREKLENFRKLEEILAAQYAAGGVTHDQVLQAKAARLAAEIDLLRAQANGR